MTSTVKPNSDLRRGEWLRTEIAKVAEMAGRYTPAEIGAALNRSPDAVRSAACKHGISMRMGGVR